MPAHTTNFFLLFCLVFSALFMANCDHKPISYKEALKQYAEKNTSQPGSFMIPSSCVIGTSFPILECTTVDNKKIDESYFKGKIGIINCWFKECVPCVAEIPGLHQLANKYGKDQLRCLSISRDSKEDILSFLEQHEWNFDHVSDGTKILKEDLALPWGYPTTFLIDQHGIINKVLLSGKSDSTAMSMIQQELAPVIDSLLLVK